MGEHALHTPHALLAAVDRLDASACGALVVELDEEPVGSLFVDRGQVCWAAAVGLGRRLRDLLREHLARTGRAAAPEDTEGAMRAALKQHTIESPARAPRAPGRGRLVVSPPPRRLPAALHVRAARAAHGRQRAALRRARRGLRVRAGFCRRGHGGRELRARRRRRPDAGGRELAADAARAGRGPRRLGRGRLRRRARLRATRPRARGARRRRRRDRGRLAHDAPPAPRRAVHRRRRARARGRGPRSPWRPGGVLPLGAPIPTPGCPR